MTSENQLKSVLISEGFLIKLALIYADTGRLPLIKNYEQCDITSDYFLSRACQGLIWPLK